MPPRVFIESDARDGTHVAATEEDSRHLAKVLRAREGDAVIAVAPSGREWDALVQRVSKNAVMLTIVREREAIPDSPIAILLGQGVGKGEKLDLVVRATTELGVSEIVPVATARAVAEGASENKAARLSRIAQEACKQSGRSRVPVVHAPESLEAFLARASACEVKLVAWEGGGGPIARAIARGTKTAAILVGPEGGLSSEEVLAAERAGFVRVSLGPRILRTETAGIVAVAALQLLGGDLA